jgi:hypothetical protein
MYLNKILNRLSQGSSGNVSEKSNAIHPKRSELTSHRDTKNRYDKKDDWASSSGFYFKLSDKQKQYVDKISDILDREDDEW